MAQTKMLQSAWTRMIQDAPRYKLPEDAAFNLQDWIPNLGDSLRKRGGWAYASPALSGTMSSATYIKAVAVADFVSGKKLIAFSDNGKSAHVISASSATQISASSNTPLQTPVMFDDLLIVTDDDGTTAPQKISSALSQTALGGSPPAAKYATVYKSRLWLANTSANPGRIWASLPLDAETWDLTDTWYEVSYPITGIAALPNSILVFMADRTARMRGSTPPPDGDFAIDDPLFSYGCTDARSIATSGPYCIFANPGGVYVTSGTNVPEDLTKSCGIKNLWISTLAGYSASTWTIAGGWYRNLYWVTVMDGSTFKDSFVMDPVDRVAWRNTNIKAIGFARDVYGSEELYWASRATDRVNGISTLYTPSSTYKNDADGTAVTPVLETPYFWDVETGDKMWRRIYARYDLVDAASDNPTITVSYAIDPNGSYTSISNALTETSAGYDDARRTIGSSGKRAPGMAFKFAQSNASANTRMSALLAEIHTREPSRV